MSQGMNEGRNRITRRAMLSGSAAGAAAVGLGAMDSIASAAPKGEPPKMREHGPNDCIRLGVIGCGGRGTYLLRQAAERAKDNPKLRVLSACEIYEARKRRARHALKKESTGKKSDGTVVHEYEELLGNPDIDAVIIATPDHWHAKIAIEAIKAGKDVYLEKPMTHTLAEAKELRDTVRWAKAVLQVGSGSTSNPKYHRAREMIRRGAIGKVVWTRSSVCRNRPGGDWNYHIDSQASPENLDWDRWLGWKWGLAPKKPFNPEHYFRFRKYWDYSGGIATDLMYHALAHLAVALGPELPSRVVASGGKWVHKDRDVPDTFMMNIDYPNEHSIFLVGTDANNTGLPEVIHGQHADMRFDPFKVEPQKAFEKECEAAKKKGALDVQAPKLLDHMGNWLECLRTRGAPTANVELGYRVQVAITLGVLAYRKNTSMEFDPKTETLKT